MLTQIPLPMQRNHAVGCEFDTVRDNGYLYDKGCQFNGYASLEEVQQQMQRARGLGLSETTEVNANINWWGMVPPVLGLMAVVAGIAFLGSRIGSKVKIRTETKTKTK